MASDSGFQSLLPNLKIDDPVVPPKAWKSIASESGTSHSSDPAQGPQDTACEISAVSEALLVRLAINALQGVKSAIVEIDKLIISFCSSSADGSFHGVLSFWSRLSSTHALGRMLKSISHSGLFCFFLHEFVNYFLCKDHKANLARSAKNKTFLIPSEQEQSKNEEQGCPPFSLVNQAFAVAVGKLLEGYICALNTLSMSTYLRRSVQCKGNSLPICQQEGFLTSVVLSELTVLEVYLHTKELRTHIEDLGSICFSHTFYQALLRDGMGLNPIADFMKFPRGADLLTYLYVQLRDATPAHYALLKYLFHRSYEPYSCFIKSWMYRATIDDPYGEFYVAESNITPITEACSPFLDKSFLASIKSGVSIPCFLKDVCDPLLRAGQQLQVLVKLLNVCELSSPGKYASFDMSILREILPFWVDSSSKLDFLSNPLIFNINGMHALIRKREIMHRHMFEKLQIYFKKLSPKDRWASHNVNSFGSMPILLGRTSVNSSFHPVFDEKSNITSGSFNVADDADSDTSSSFTESVLELEPSLSTEGSSNDYNDENKAAHFYDSHVNMGQPLKSLFSNLPADYAKSSILQTYANKTNQPHLNIPLHSFAEHVYPSTFCPYLQHQRLKVHQISAPSNYDAIMGLKISGNLTEVNQSGGCWPLGGLLSNPFCAYKKCNGPQERQLTERCFENDVEVPDQLKCEKTFFSEAFCSLVLSFHGLGEMQTSTGTIGFPFCHSSSCRLPNTLSMNPMLTKNSWLPVLHNSRNMGFISNSTCLPYFNFSSLTDPVKLYIESLPISSCKISMDEASIPEKCGDPVKATVENQPVSDFCSASETNIQRDAQPSNAYGGADWTKSLNYPIKNATYDDSDIHSEQKFLVPLDVIIDKCILQEILLQYKYISCLTIQFLEEGFSFREYLLALRRYHFMEISDWADLFVMSLDCQKWSAFEHELEAARIQGFLDMALQRSSCENDPYKQRLFIYIKGQSIFQPVFANGVCAFDFVALGFRVDWPVNIIVTQDSLEIYANIFSFLIQIRLAVASLIDVWHYLKDVFYVLNLGQQKTLFDAENFNSVMRVRQHIYYFTTTLQQYVQSQLLEVSWCQFEHSLKHTVKNIMDLESEHMFYLTNAVRICFLSDNAKEIAAVIKNILQCALDLRSCFLGRRFAGLLNEKDESCSHSQINFAKVADVNAIFKKNLKELYLLSLKSPKHGEFSICRFWSNLDSNGFFSSIISKMP